MLLVPCSWSLVTCYSLLFTFYSLLITFYSLLVTHYLLFITCSSFPLTCYFLLLFESLFCTWSGDDYDEARFVLTGTPDTCCSEVFSGSSPRLPDLANQGGIIPVNLATRLTRNLKTSQEIFVGTFAKISLEQNLQTKMSSHKK